MYRIVKIIDDHYNNSDCYELDLEFKELVDAKNYKKSLINKLSDIKKEYVDYVIEYNGSVEEVIPKDIWLLCNDNYRQDNIDIAFYDYNEAVKCRDDHNEGNGYTKWYLNKVRLFNKWGD